MGPWVSGGRFYDLESRQFDGTAIVVSKETSASKAYFNNPILNDENSGVDVDQRVSHLGGEFEINSRSGNHEAAINHTKPSAHRFHSTEWSWLWGNFAGWPTAVAEFQARSVFAGYKRFPGRLTLSRTSQPLNMTTGSESNDGVNLNVADSKGPVTWLAAGEDLLVGTSKAEFAVRGRPLTPSNFSADSQGSAGGDGDQAVTVDDNALFSTRSARGFREMSFRFERDRYVRPDLSDLARHLFEPIVEAGDVRRQPTLIQEPETYIALIQDGGLEEPFDGGLNVLSYRRENGVVAWSRWPMGDFGGLGDLIVSLCGVSADTQDELWVGIRRFIDGAYVDYLEIFEPSALLDSELTVGGTPPRAAVPGYDHMEGRTLQVIADGVYIGEFVVNASGELDLSSALGSDPVSVTAGLEIPCQMGLQVLHTPPDAQGAKEGRNRNVTEAIVLLNDSVGGTMGHDPDPATIPDGKFEVLLPHTIGAAGNLTGVTKWARASALSVPTVDGEEEPILIRQNVPGRFEVLAIVTDPDTTH